MFSLVDNSGISVIQFEGEYPRFIMLDVDGVVQEYVSVVTFITWGNEKFSTSPALTEASAPSDTSIPVTFIALVSYTSGTATVTVLLVRSIPPYRYHSVQGR